MTWDLGVDSFCVMKVSLEEVLILPTTPTKIPAQVAHGLATLGTLHLVTTFFLEEPDYDEDLLGEGSNPFPTG